MNIESVTSGVAIDLLSNNRKRKNKTELMNKIALKKKEDKEKIEK